VAAKRRRKPRSEKTAQPRGESNRVGILAGGRVSEMDPKYIFGTEEWVANRVSTGYPSDRVPSQRPTAFVQIPPIARSRRSLNDPRIAHRAGDLKFSDGL
jgi:hypothetical protein